MKDRHNTKKSPKGGMGIRTRIILFFTSFVLLIICVIYIVQIGMLSVFYRNTKYDEFKKVADAISAVIGTPKADQVILQYGLENKTCILVLNVENGELKEQYMSVDESRVCVIHHLTNAELENLYKDALNNDGKKITTQKVDSRFIEDTGFLSNKSITVALLVMSVTDQKGDTYALFIDSELSPMNTFTNTLKTQFIWVAVTLLLASGISAYLFSIRITGPLRRMNEKAKKLAMGDYTPDFKEEGYKETCELASTLNYAATEISKSEKLRRELISNVSHDLRTPLTMISGYAEVMRDIPGENTPENVQMIIDEAKHLSELVNDMLDLSRIESGKKQVQPERLPLSAVVSTVLARYSALVEHDGYDISFEKDSDEDVFINADRTMIIQVLYNLVNNAVNYTGSDKVVVVRQNLKGEGTNRIVRISVCDTGAGIRPENIGNIWERYYREEGNHKRATVGTGLGLSIVRDILQKHKASFGVESTLGVGSTFWFEFPTVE